MRRRSLALALVTLGLLVALAALAVPARAQESDVTVPGPTDQVSVPDGDIIPRPNSGAEPEEPGDRGGALQLAVLVAIVAGVATVTTLAVRDSRRAQRARQRTRT